MGDRFDKIMAMHNRSQLTDIMHTMSCDFLNKDIGAPWAVSGIASGSNDLYYTVSAIHPGVCNYQSSTTADSGYRAISSAVTLKLVGGEKFTIIFRTGTTQIENVTRRMGFHTTAVVTAPSDGAYIKIDSAVVTGQTVASSTASNTETNYTVAANTWYRATVEVNADASLITFTLYADNSETVLWADTLATNIPTSGLGASDVCTYANAGAEAAKNIGGIDYIGVYLPTAGRII